MSQTADKHYVEQWKATALHQYQAGGFALRNTTTPPDQSIVGESRLSFVKVIRTNAASNRIWPA